jgi:hypothetical protein
VDLVTNSYSLDPRFEQEVCALLATNPTFWNRLGPHLAVEGFADARAKLVVEVCLEIYEQTARAPSSSAVVLQQLRRRYDTGKLKLSTLENCADYMDDALDKGLPELEVAISTLAACVKQVKNLELVDAAFVAQAGRAGLADVATRMQAVEDIGKVNVTYGVGLDGFAAELDAQGDIERLPIGFQALDAETEGGMARGEFGFWLAGTKVGKSMALVGNAVIGYMRGLNVYCATLELGTAKWRARLLGTVTGTPYQDIMKRRSQSVAFERLQAMREDGDTFGSFTINKFGGHQTNLAAVLEWVQREEDRTQRGCDLLVIDYADKLCGNNLKEGDYTQMRDVYEGIRLFAESRNIWAWSASQATRIAMGEMPTINHCADSQHKVRCTDVMVGITRYPDEDNKVGAKILAMRNGSGDGAEAGPLPNGFDFGCFVRNTSMVGTVEAALMEGDDGDALGIFA